MALLLPEGGVHQDNGGIGLIRAVTSVGDPCQIYAQAVHLNSFGVAADLHELLAHPWTFRQEAFSLVEEPIEATTPDGSPGQHGNIDAVECGDHRDTGPATGPEAPVALLPEVSVHDSGPLLLQESDIPDVEPTQLPDTSIDHLPDDREIFGCIDRLERKGVRVLDGLRQNHRPVALQTADLVVDPHHGRPQEGGRAMCHRGSVVQVTAHEPVEKVQFGLRPALATDGCVTLTR